MNAAAEFARSKTIKQSNEENKHANENKAADCVYLYECKELTLICDRFKPVYSNLWWEWEINVRHGRPRAIKKVNFFACTRYIDLYVYIIFSNKKVSSML